MTKRQLLIILLIAFFVGAIGSIFVGRFFIPQIASLTGWESLNSLVTNSPIVINRTTEVQLNDGVNMIELAKQVGNSTVSIYDGAEGRQVFRGLGVVLSSDGLIFTSKNAIGSNPNVTVVLNDGRKFTALVRAADPKSDLAVITIEATGLATANFGSSFDLKAGQRVIRTGMINRSFDRELHSGLVTKTVLNNQNLDQAFSTEKFSNAFVTELNNQTNHVGSPLFNLEGRLVGMIMNQNNEMIVAENIQTALGSYFQNNKIIRPRMGLQYTSLSTLQSTLRNHPRAGVVVVAVDRGSAAADAGLLPNDLIYEVNNQSLENSNFEQILNQSNPDGEMKLKFVRTGKDMEVTVKLKPTQ
jgi:serine protease Do